MHQALNRSVWVVLIITVTLVWFWPEDVMVFGQFWRPDYRHQLPASQAIPAHHTAHDGLGVYWIHLARAQDRAKRMPPLLDKLGWPWRWVHGVDGLSLSPTFFKQHVDAKKWRHHFFTPLYVGAVGCSLSHYRAMRAFLASHQAFALIFEDDVRFEPTVLHAIVSELMMHADAWDVVNFDVIHRSDAPLHFYKRLMLQHRPHVLVMMRAITWGAGAYLLNRHAAQALLATANPIQMPIDFHTRQDWEMHILTTAIYPIVVHQLAGQSLRMQSPKWSDSSASVDLMSVFLAQSARTWYRNIYHFWHHVCAHFKVPAPWWA